MFLNGQFFNGHAGGRANRACAGLAPMLEQIKNEGKTPLAAPCPGVDG